MPCTFEVLLVTIDLIGLRHDMHCHNCCQRLSVVELYWKKLRGFELLKLTMATVVTMVTIVTVVTM